MSDVPFPHSTRERCPDCGEGWFYLRRRFVRAAPEIRWFGIRVFKHKPSHELRYCDACHARWTVPWTPGTEGKADATT